MTIFVAEKQAEAQKVVAEMQKLAAEAHKAAASAEMRKAELELESNKAILETKKIELDLQKFKRPADDSEIPDAKRQRLLRFNNIHNNTIGFIQG